MYGEQTSNKKPVGGQQVDNVDGEWTAEQVCSIR